MTKTSSLLYFCQKPTLLLNANYAHVFYHLLIENIKSLCSEININTIISTLTGEENHQVYCLYLMGEDGEMFCPQWTAGVEKLDRRHRSMAVVEPWTSVICHSHSATNKQKIFLFVFLTKQLFTYLVIAAVLLHLLRPRSPWMLSDQHGWKCFGLKQMMELILCCRFQSIRINKMRAQCIHLKHV